MARLLSIFIPVPDPSLGPDEADSRLFTPEAMDEYEQFLLESFSPVPALAA